VKSRQDASSRASLGTIASHAALLLGSIIMLLPFYWMLITALKSYPETLKIPATWLPNGLHWENFVRIFADDPLWGRYFFNSFYTSILTVIGEVIFAVLAAYAFSRMEFVGKNILFFLFLATMMVPGEVLLVPNYQTVKSLGWINTYSALTVPWMVSVFGIFLLRQHFLQIPKELQEAAYLDGAGHLRFLAQIMVPLSRPPIATVALLKFIGSWNAFTWPLFVVFGQAGARVKPISLALFDFTSTEQLQYHLWMAASVLAVLPVMILFLATQKQFMESVAKSGLKG
jgi:multiple sugar transport system permease protein